jgi:type IV pilus assembly protein PilV
MNMSTRPRHSRQSGVSLLEVLISIVILSIGLLGSAGLIMNGLKNSNTAYYRSQATILASDILDRMRANLPNDRTPRLTQAGYYVVALNGSCGASGMPYQDCTQWRQLIASTLPDGKGAVAVSADGIVTVTIQWNSPADTFITTSRL